MKEPVNDAQLRRSFKNKTLQNSLFASYVLALILLVSSHRALYSPANKEDDKLLSVPFPRRQAAKGGLPPVPDVVKQKLDNGGHNDRNNDASGGAASTPSFPLPSDAVPSESVSPEIILQPTYGSHRPRQNAVFAFAEGYDLNVYVTFIESLKNTGYTGDVVLSVSYIEGMKSGVKDYLEWYSQQQGDSLRVISYALTWECYKKSGVRILPTNKEGRGSTTNHGFSDCKMHGLYSDGKDNNLSRAEDPREARPVATARYELYWIWSKQYHENSSILIIDARDAYFQSNPFNFRSSHDVGHVHLGDVHLQMNQQSYEECTLDLFEENYEAVNIAKSQFNSRWIKTAYGQQTLKKLSLKPVICSGSTMGTQTAIELYSVAMVAQFDKTKCKQVGCDQGFHNYLFYEGGLEQYLASHSCTINVHKQGDGTVNNLAAMRNSPLRSQGVLSNGKTRNGAIDDTIIVFNHDKSTPSPVLHQFDRDNELKGIIRKRTSEMVTQW
eukprot:CAMPEP_0172531706 /NCGR_PEP_ID=MMETSP1067-20121228/4998_1 /TAXON_ID=265564 ORGANISM="Thalassiosira punctigera, Strain Tpunct2005C2" /NCGR_SAMPLE_ID=MMETSP1067 /ASSEMBLY_ACC=CAM_ASM_000444 /LENGTH=496 /DNA_ID=CAMNT_0013316109 /DNA_START=154 /DNA_END=1641 /DNA_ORIENTATION=+